MLTAFFLYVILGATDTRAPKGFAPLAIGLSLTLIHLVSIPVSNTSVNPARSTGPRSSPGPTRSASSGCSGWRPLVGGSIAGATYALLFGKDAPRPLPLTEARRHDERAQTRSHQTKSKPSCGSRRSRATRRGPTRGSACRPRAMVHLGEHLVGRPAASPRVDLARRRSTITSPSKACGQLEGLLDAVRRRDALAVPRGSRVTTTLVRYGQRVPDGVVRRAAHHHACCRVVARKC